MDDIPFSEETLHLIIKEASENPKKSFDAMIVMRMASQLLRAMDDLKRSEN